MDLHKEIVKAVELLKNDRALLNEQISDRENERLPPEKLESEGRKSELYLFLQIYAANYHVKELVQMALNEEVFLEQSKISELEKVIKDINLDLDSAEKTIIKLVNRGYENSF